MDTYVVQIKIISRIFWLWHFLISEGIFEGFTIHITTTHFDIRVQLKDHSPSQEKLISANCKEGTLCANQSQKIFGLVLRKTKINPPQSTFQQQFIFLNTTDLIHLNWEMIGKTVSTIKLMQIQYLLNNKHECSMCLKLASHTTEIIYALADICAFAYLRPLHKSGY